MSRWGSLIVGLPFHPAWKKQGEKTDLSGLDGREFYLKDPRGRDLSFSASRFKNNLLLRERERITESADSDLTSRAASEDQFTDFIIDKDEQGVREGAEPPVGPEKHTKTGEIQTLDSK